ncbi:addiction module antidote protein [Testudinibacter sp. TR-2022]|uniref:addiction module antidote protein n=1 Tax=Testudinibacter sp. TR-2022 TaxID=2585029 RepID=UPI00111AF32E|nr:addiction module antidote protein [Testudinibacter sp. TR-2022]TNH06430.1 putative addiction module antidote protein [Pasteurellaceae bacterium Phil11]TNH22967.1 putative addiction module antidote protein [Testudinibacter sp. TR-2022]TNH27693.1 putative addiction module antidote protein [Testudinibacter sp. TR-2022]
MTESDLQLEDYDPAEFLNNEEDMKLYLNEALKDGNISLVLSVLGDIARARNVSQLSKEVGISREGLYKALSGKGNPSFSTTYKIIQALGMRLEVHAG